ncbi:MAG: glycosyltransferase family 2 protein [Lawsonibacter sp.]|nr:glycosyltransferase family 2 protein [Lawsonibacter sp.]
MDRKVTVYTKVYNTECYLRQCIESVLSQSYSNFEYILVDNGCTDGSSKILEEYAKLDGRIHLIRYEKNQKINIQEFILSNATGDFLAVLDSDDWWEPTFLECLLNIAEENDLDIVCTGTVVHYVASGNESSHKVSQPLLFPRKTFANRLPYYHIFFRTVWGKLIKMDCLRAVPVGMVPELSYGRDTVWCFQFLRYAKRIGIDNFALYHYRVHAKSVSRQYNPERFESDVYLYNDAVDFLINFGPVSAPNRYFLQRVYCNAVVDTVHVICNSSLPPESKLKEYRIIAVHPLTQAAYRECKSEDAVRSRKLLVSNAILAGKDLKGQSDKELRTILQTLLPNCGRAVTGQNISVFCRHKKLLDPLYADQPESMLRGLLRLLRKSRCEKSDILQILQLLTVDNLLLSQIDDIEFLQQYGDIYTTIWQGRQFDALDAMTGLLLDGKVSCGRRQFLQLYISLAAVLEQVPAFIFGKMQLAWNFLEENSLEECENIVAELENMGVADCEELDSLRNEIALKSSD